MLKPRDKTARTPLRPGRFLTFRSMVRSGLRADRRAGEDAGFATGLALLVALALTVAMIVEISRFNNNTKASSQTVDARKAKEAAEFGMAAILDQLNNLENHYLLATRLSNPSGTGDWQTVTSSSLTSCNIQPPSTAPSANRIPGVSTNISNSTVAMPGDPSVSYSLVSYLPPSEIGSPTFGCDMFGNRLGGRARLVVRGTVQRNGTTMASFDSTRDVYIRTEGPGCGEQPGPGDHGGAQQRQKRAAPSTSCTTRTAMGPSAPPAAPSPSPSAM